MRILLLSAYDADSHRRWREQLVCGLPEFDWTCLHLPARHFSWRIRGNALSWSQLHAETLTRGYDLLLATSMVDLATLKGLVPALSRVPSLVYFHENQFAYPSSPHQKFTLEPQMVTLYAALSASQLAFNSRYNLESFLQGVGELLAKLPDHVPTGLVEQLAEKACVLPVPVGAAEPVAVKNKGTERFHLIWNHRWEYDKGPDKLLALVKVLPEALPLRIHIVGQQFRNCPAAFAEIEQVLRDKQWLGEWGYVESGQKYQALLQSCQLVLSTSLHDFQGLSVLEAVASGCLPLVPDRLAYRELFNEAYRYYSEYSPGDRRTHTGGAKEAQACAAAICARVQQWQHTSLPAPPDISALSWSSLAQAYRQLIQATVRS